MAPSSGEITLILQRWDNDRESAVQELTPIVYGELRKIAAAYWRNQRPNHTLQPTALINEAYVRLIRQDVAALKDRSHFFTLAARMMRQILADYARSHNAEKRGAGNRVTLDEHLGIGDGKRATDFLAVHEALDSLQKHNDRMASAIELHYFGGLQLEEIGEALSISLATVKRDLTFGKAWLRRALSE